MRGKKVLEECMEIAALHAKERQELLWKQADLLAKLDAEGKDTSAARRLLNETCELLRQHQSDWVRATHELKKPE